MRRILATTVIATALALAAAASPAAAAIDARERAMDSGLVNDEVDQVLEACP